MKNFLFLVAAALFGHALAAPAPAAAGLGALSSERQQQVQDYIKTVEASITGTQYTEELGAFTLTIDDPDLLEPIVIPIGPQAPATSTARRSAAAEARDTLSKRSNACYPGGNHWMYLEGVLAHTNDFCNMLNSPTCPFCTVRLEKRINGTFCILMSRNLAGIQRTVGAGLCRHEMQYVLDACRYTSKNPDGNPMAWTRGGWTKTSDNSLEHTFNPERR